jgi:hypothetical protein
VPETRFEALRLELLQGGVAPVYVERTIVELDEHYADLEDAALAAGQSEDEAARMARDTLGDEHAIAAAILSRPELLGFSGRYPRVAHCLHSAAAIGAIPGMPLVYCIEHRPELARWGAAFSLAVTFVGGILAALDWLIALA